MKISASIYSDKKRPLKDVVLDLVAHQVDLLHVDCNDDVSVFEDIKKIRTWCELPIDLHIITPYPSKYKNLIRDNPVEYVTFQYEDLKEKIEFPSNFTGKKGLAVITPTDVSVFQEYEDFDFILVMATIPGQSGGVFDTFNFSKIRKFKKIYPAKSVHVDGGVNGEVSFILRNMGVSSSVSGSYLFNGPSIGHALMNLTKRNVESQFVLRDFMIPLAETPVIHENNLTFKHVLETIEKGKLGFAIVVRENNEFVGIVSNADVRKSLLNSIDDLTNLNVTSMINRDSVGIQEKATVNEMLQLIKKYAFPITYLPVLDEAKNAVGIVTFVNLIRGEI
jgi:pentose-5-phosphate-3-epimerase/predicted transcriptional regulator